ncbi:lipopolysaccharide assembly protein LapA domain-containing protein [Pseudomonas cedrina]|uniref:lipopolysaccharide assembly protein LapA domain-containing protein n=1 Tax=Pseudomonas cedrina TaxID=651740 RepID=UPI00373FDEA7
MIVLSVLAFVLENQQALALSFFGWATPQVPVSVFIIISLIIGLLLGPLLGLAFQRKARRRSVSSGS